MLNFLDFHFHPIEYPNKSLLVYNNMSNHLLFQFYPRHSYILLHLCVRIIRFVFYHHHFSFYKVYIFLYLYFSYWLIKSPSAFAKWSHLLLSLAKTASIKISASVWLFFEVSSSSVDLHKLSIPSNSSIMLLYFIKRRFFNSSFFL